MGQASTRHWLNKLPSGIRYKRTLIIPLSRAFERRAEEAQHAAWLALPESEKSKRVVTAEFVVHDPPEPKLPFGLRMANPTELFMFGR
jgi:hypothetical protein